jgi:8-oxo-dGTP pyrophosphatase MutT (NUDIX family)
MTPPPNADDLDEPLPDAPARQQVAALCLRAGAQGPEVLLVSSLQTRRWILPKGWPMEGRSNAEAALQEAWEEAGVTGSVEAAEIGSYGYYKIRKSGLPVPCRVSVFRVDVTALADTYPEQAKRKRLWVPTTEAADMVHERELKDLLRAL